MPAPDPQPPYLPDELGFELLTHPEPVHRIRSFVSGDPAGERLRLLFWRRREDGEVRARAWFGPDAEGPPGHGHGGALAGVLDEVMGVAAWEAGHAVVLARFTVEYRAPLPLLRDVACRATITKVDGRRIEVVGQVGLPELGDAAVFTTAKGLYIVPEPAVLERLGIVRPAR